MERWRDGETERRRGIEWRNGEIESQRNRKMER